jgi:hypothetical protein
VNILILCFFVLIITKEKNYCRQRKTGKIVIDDFKRRVIGDAIQEFYLRKKVVPTVRKFMPVLHEKTDWRWSKTSLKRLLKDMGFFWKISQNKRVVLIECADIVDWRSKYLIQMKQCRVDAKRDILFR